MIDLPNPPRIVIVGGVAGGASAAARARRCNADAEITVLEKGPAVSFANCGLPYHLGGEIESRDKLIVATPELFWNRFRIRVKTGHEVTHIDRQACTVTGRTREGKDFKLPYDRLILATGSEPYRPPFMEDGGQNVFQLWTLDDMDAILDYMQRRPCKKATVIGAGFVGLEVVEQLQRREIEVSLVERLPQVLSPLDSEMARLVEHELLARGVQLHLSASVERLLTDNQRTSAVELADGQTIATDLVIAGTGVRPRTQLAREAGLELGQSGGLLINDYCQTSDPKIYAVGDMVEYYHGTLQSRTLMPLAGPANRAGRVAGAHAACGTAKPLGQVQGTAIVRVFELSAACTGLNERACRQSGIEYRTATIQATHHAGYFPGAQLLTLKILYAPSGKLLGAQAVGPEGIDKRIDVVATMLHMGGTIDDLANLDLCYAPPFGAAKDPIHMAAFVAQNDLAMAPRLAAFDADFSDFQIVDVRSASELSRLPHLPGATHIPLDELSDRLHDLQNDKPMLTVCHSGKRAHVAACLLQGKGFQGVHNLSGGMSLQRLRSPSAPGTEEESNKP